MRGWRISSLRRSVSMSMPNTSQSAVSMMRFKRLWPIKPFTPRIRIFFTPVLSLNLLNLILRLLCLFKPCVRKLARPGADLLVNTSDIFAKQSERKNDNANQTEINRKNRRYALVSRAQNKAAHPHQNKERGRARR